MRKREVLILLILVLMAAGVQAQTTPGQEYSHIIANSEDWHDVYSIIHYANLKEVSSDFLVSTSHGNLIIPGLSKSLDIRVVSSENRPFVINYPSQLLAEEYADADEITVENANLELIEDLPEVTNFIIVGELYGYSAIAVAPYAVISDSWVFFADSTNVDEIDALLSTRQVDSLLIFGFVEDDVIETLSPYNPEILDDGDRFSNNIAIVERYMEIKPVKQVVLTNGEFIEREVMLGLEPVLFTGRDNVPDQIRDYLRESDIEVGVLVGSDLVGAATNIRRSTGISVIVKFARGARVPSSSISNVEGLDLFYAGSPIIDLLLHTIKYNSATSQLEVTYNSVSNVPIYFKGTINPQDESGELPTLGDVDPIFIAPNDFKTISYSGLDFTGDSLLVELDTVYGESPSAMDNILSDTFEVEIVNVIDSCDITIEKVTYSKPADEFKIRISNDADIDCWVDVELNDIIIDNDPFTLGSEGSTEIREGKSKNVIIEEELSDEDLEDNSLVDVTAYYGEREDNLVKIQRATFDLNIQVISFVMILIIIIIIIIIILLILFFWKRRKDKKEDDW